MAEQAARLGADYKGPARAPEPAHVIRSDDEAVEIATRLAGRFAENALERDRERRLPLPELDEFSQSGLWGLTVPESYGGPDVSFATLARVFTIVSAADGSIGQIPQNHYSMVDIVRGAATDAQKQTFYAEILAGVRYGNAFAERGSKTTGHFETKIRLDSDGNGTVNGQKFYCSGALLAHCVPVAAMGVHDDQVYVAMVPRDAPGLEVIDDWSSFGQRTTASGTVLFRDVEVPAAHVIRAQKSFENPTGVGAIAQIMHAAIDLGIADGAIRDTIDFVRRYTRPWIDSGNEHGYEDPYLIHEVGKLKLEWHAAEAMLERSGRALDHMVSEPSDDAVAAGSIAVAEAKILSTEISIAATNKLFELAGTRATFEEYGFDRHWRNARTHTLHDPVRWKYRAIGDYYLNGINPPRHAYI